MASPHPSADPSASTAQVVTRPAWHVVVIGVVGLAVAMGIGRFAFTPLMPLMLRDGTISAAMGAEWATANYVGYLIGALTASRFASDPTRGLKLAMIGVVVTTLSVAWISGPYIALMGALLRGAAGVFSAWALVCASSWCLAELARRKAARAGGAIYSGVGTGIAIAGTLSWLGGRQPARSLWIEMGLLAAVGGAFVWLLLRANSASAPASTAQAAPRAVAARRSGHLAVVLCYGVCGFGYIVPATFLPAMAREIVSDPLVFGLTWPVFGLASALSVAAAARWLSSWPRCRVWALAHGVMALGTALPIVSQSMWALALSAVFVGGTFMLATMAGLQRARELEPMNPTPLLARLTVAFAAGQIVGPLLIRLMGDSRVASLNALTWAYVLATASLAITTVWLLRESESSAATLEKAT